MTSANRIAIVGMAGRFPMAASVEELWSLLVEGREASVPLADEDLRAAGVPERLIRNPHFVKIAYPVEGIDQFDAAYFQFTPREAEITDPQHRMLLECCHEALEHGGYDPDRYDGLVGVYAGVGSMGYFIRNLSTDPDLLETMGTLRLSIGNEKSFASTMVSYRLDLRGPSVNVDTACSTSLVAVHQACQSLLSHECDMALAGGVSLDVPQKAGMLYKEGGIVAPDGHCRPFDRNAKGTVKGNGAGIVLLKRLEDAIADGDTIHAVILGSAVNNDGAVKVGYTASSIEGQADVIADAFARADIEPETVGYVEAHGTGTILGDPIEISALTDVFAPRTAKRQFCAVGSLKSNIGHLDIAAGVAGLIKAAEAVKRGVIPPTINYSGPNPNIDFAATPFRVADRLEAWSDENGPRRAGVSSFGIGGTNVHVLLEQAPATDSSEEDLPAQLLVLSARSRDALRRQMENMAARLRTDTAINIADAAYTLQIGRRVHELRAAVAGCDAMELADALEKRARQLGAVEPVAGEPHIYFMFPGQGAQHVGMARGLHSAEPVFRAAFDECATRFSRELGRDLAEVIFGDEEALNQTLFTQPALFTVEYAMARLWMSYGVEPQGMLGHSIGEYVAACLAGVLPLEDAVSLVAARAKLMQSLPGGIMLMVNLPEEGLGPYLSQEVSLAATNGPQMCVLSGTPDGIAAVETALDDACIQTRRLHCSHAFHSVMMDPILEAFGRKVAGLRLSAPKIRYVSNVTGTWITDAQATDPAYWVDHLRGTVRFGAGLSTLLEDAHAALVEVGPGQVLTTLARRSFNIKNRAVPTARHAQDTRDDAAMFLQAYGQLWTIGFAAEWDRLHGDSPRRRIPLPTYPFDRKRYWIEPKIQAPALPAAAAADLPVRDVADGVARAATAMPETAPRTIREQLTGIWRSAFGVEEIGDDDGFFELGGDSLLATQLTSVVRDQLGLDLSLSDLFEAPRMGDLVALLESKHGTAGPAATESMRIPRVEPDLARRHEPFPLTDIQQAYWVGRTGTIELGQVSTHIYLEVAIKDGEIPRFSAAWNRLVAHHDMLRSVFLPSGEQKILAEVPTYIFDVLDVRGRDPAEAEAAALALRDKMSHQILPADRWPLFDIKAVQFADRQFRLCISIDILIVDAWSMNMLIEQWLQLYKEPERPLPPVAFSFRDYVIAEHGLRETELFRRSERYWFDRIESLPGAPDLPLAMAPSAITDPVFVRRMYQMDRGRWSRLKQRALAMGITPSGLLAAAFSEVLALWCRSPQFCINLTLYTRHPFHQDVDHIVGDFTSLTLLEIDNSTPGPFSATVERVQKQLWRDLDHRFVSAIHVLREMSRRNGSRVSMPIVFTSTLGVRTLEHETDDMQDFGEEVFGVSQTSQVWLDHQVMEWNGRLRFNWDAVDALFPPGMIDDMFQAYCRFVERLAEDESAWNQPVGPSLLPPAHGEVIDRSNTTDAPFELELLHHGFEKQARRTPDAPAVIAADRTLTYAELLGLAHGLAHRLAEIGIGRAEPVGLFLDKGWEQVVGVMGVLAAGGAYLPVDPGLPAERLQYVLQNSGARVVVTRSGLRDRLPDLPGSPLVVLDIADIRPVVADSPVPATGTTLDDLAYVIYTSGSTGMPKGVMVPHRGAANTIADINDRVGLSPSDRVFAISALNFDLSVYDLFGTLSCGAAMVIPRPEELRDPARWGDLIEEHGVTFWNSVPALMQMLVDHVADSGRILSRRLRLVMMSGDWIPPALPGRMHTLWPETAVLGAGGPTECSIWSACHPVQPEDWSKESVPYGKPLKNQQIHILNERLQTCPLWVPGEMYISGDGLALGYMADPVKTDKAFIVHPDTGLRLYRSGDLGRWLPNGDIEFLGRNDFQVKVNGYRIELAEVEAALKQCGPYKDVVVVAATERGTNNRKRLVAYMVTGAAEGAVPAPALPAGEVLTPVHAVEDTHAKLVEFKLRKPGLRPARPGDRPLALPPAARDEGAWRRRKSYRAFQEGAVTLDRLSATLACLSGCPNDHMPLPKYRYASAGSLHGVQVYLYVKPGRVEGLEGGIYYYHPEDHSLVAVSAPETPTRAHYGTGENPDVFDRSGFAIYFVGKTGALSPVYGDEAAREFLFLEAGYMGQLLMETAPEQQVGLCPIGYLDEGMRRILGLEQDQLIVHSMVGGGVTADQVNAWTGDAPRASAAAAVEDGDRLREQLRERLPDYMIPAAFVFLEKLPLTANGKVDRRSLSELGVISKVQRTVTPPRNEVEQRLLALWQETLGQQEIGVEDNFFELGGDSVLIVRMHKDLAAMFGPSVSVVDLFKYPKISDLAAYLANTAEPETAEPDPVPVNTVDRQKAALMRQRKLAAGAVGND